MSEHGKDRFVFAKSYEIAYALFRIAATLREHDFAERLRAAAGGLLESSAVQEYPATRRSLQAIECFVKFAGDVNLLAPANADTILREVYLLDAAVVERMNAATSSANDVNLSEIFSDSGNAATGGYAPVSTSVDDPLNAPAEDSRGIANDSVDPIGSVQSNHRPEPSRDHNFMKAEMRQSAIIDRIRQYGNCRLKDIQEILPGCSERTIRYDLQSLLERNLIERTGAGGPAVTYRMRQTVG